MQRGFLSTYYKNASGLAIPLFTSDFFLLNLTSKALEPANQAYISKEIPLLTPTSQFEDELIYFKREIRFELIVLLG